MKFDYVVYYVKAVIVGEEGVEIHINDGGGFFN